MRIKLLCLGVLVTQSKSESMNSNVLNEVTLSQWMTANIDGFAGPIEISKFAGGQSNPTFKISTPNKNYVLRRKPMGTLLPGAHSVDREYRIISALGKTGFPVPQTYGICDDDNVIGSMFYVMEMVEGRIFWNQSFAEIPQSERFAYFDAMNQVLARLHGIDYKAIGLGDYGKEGQFVERQIKLWTRQYLADEDAGRNPDMDKLIAWLPQSIPAFDETTIIHGDYRSDNMVFHPTEPRIIAVLDWELSTLGNPLADFTYHLMAYHMPQGWPSSVKGIDYSAFGLPTEQQSIDAYLRRTGRQYIENISFYVAFNMFRLAAILHGIKGRLIRGNAANKDAAKMVERFDELAHHAWLQAVAAGAK